jgi:hypothetical protein
MHSHTEQTREARIRVLIQRLESGTDVQARDLKIVLGLDGYREYQQRWRSQKELRTMEKPSDLTEYEALLKKALLAYAKFEKFGGRTSARSNLVINRSAKVQELRNAADTAFERALEFLSEAVHRDPSIQVWFDRNLDFTAGSEPSTDPVGMPRVVTSRSTERLASKEGRFGIQTKREVKIEALRDALIDKERKGKDDLTQQARMKKLLAVTRDWG